MCIRDRIKGALQNIYGGRIRSDGAPLDGKGVALSTSDLPERNPSPAYDAVGRQYLVVWERAGDIRGARLTVKNEALSVEDPNPGLDIAGADGRQTSPRVAYAKDGHNMFAVWQSVPIGATTSDVI